MHFRIQGLPAEQFVPLFALSDDALRERGAVRTVADGPRPCRISLTDAAPGDELDPGQLRASRRCLALPHALCDLRARGRRDVRRYRHGAGAVAQAHARGARLRRQRDDDRLGIDRGRQARRGDRAAVRQSAHGLSARALRRARLLRRAHRAGVTAASALRRDAEQGVGPAKRAAGPTNRSALPSLVRSKTPTRCPCPFSWFFVSERPAAERRRHGPCGAP